MRTRTRLQLVLRGAALSALPCLALLVHAACTGEDPATTITVDNDAAGSDGNPNPQPDGSVPPMEAGAPVVLGQPDEFSNLELELSASGLGVALANGKLLVSERGRILIWNTIPTTNGQRPDVVVGQRDLKGSGPAGGAPSGPNESQFFSFFRGDPLATDGARLVVADSLNHRALVWSAIPTQNFAPATTILGQPNAMTNTRPTTPLANNLAGPRGVHISNAKLYVADSENSRVLVWNAVPSGNTQANVLVGQPDFITNQKCGQVDGGATSASCLNHPASIFATTDKLFVADTGHNRVLIWDPAPTTNGVAATRVLGQPGMSGNTPNAGGISAQTMSGPQRVLYDGTKLYVSDTGNNRVLVWDALPTQDGQAASSVLGQSDFTSSAERPIDGTSLSAPNGLAKDGARLAIADTGHARVLLWNTAPSNASTPADRVVGRPTMTATDVRGGVDGKSFPGVGSLATDGTRLVVADSGRVLVFNRIPAPNEDANIVLGQPNLTSRIPSSGVASATTFSNVAGVWCDATKLAVADENRSRVLVWTSPLTSNQQPANLVLGQADFTGLNENRAAGASAVTMRRPHGVYSDGTRLVVADFHNHRVLLWKSFPTSPGQAADLELGQATMSNADENRGGAPGAGTLRFPEGVVMAGGRLIVSDGGNNRVLIWNQWPTQDGQAADVVLGQSSMDTASVGALSASNMSNPSSVGADRDRLYVVDTGHNRVLRWNTIPTMNGARADSVYGQVDFTTSGNANAGGLNGRTLSTPLGIAGLPNRLLIGDSGNRRIVILPVP